jgi:hypothetical protein
MKYLNDAVREYDEYGLPSEYLDEYESISEWADGSGLR